MNFDQARYEVVATCLELAEKGYLREQEGMSPAESTMSILRSLPLLPTITR